MATGLIKRKATFGTAPVFFTAISTILGAIMFLRFGYAVGHVGFVGAVAIVVIGHLVTIPTAMALAEIATNQKVEGGGEYYIISRSFGLVTGAAIGVALFLSQAISVAFYVIAFAEAFAPLLDLVQSRFGIALDPRLVSAPATLVLAVVILRKGAALGVKALYVVVGILFISLLTFFLGRGATGEVGYQTLIETVESPAPFFLVFAIVFPAFTGMTAGVGLSGDLKNPSRSIPIGTLSATLLGMVIYIAIAMKLAVSATPEQLAVTDRLVMADISLWGPIIPIGLAAATISSALGSALVAPRTLQALGADRIFPSLPINRWLSSGRGETQEPVNASVVVFGIALFFVLIGDVDLVAQVISMFFMVTYGSICLISFLEHFAANPSYRPVFRSRWYVSLLGALMCLWLMFKMSTAYALLAVVVMFLLYLGISYYHPERQGLAALFQGAIFQISRQLQVFLQKSAKAKTARWRPSIVCISKTSFDRLAAFDLLRWISHRYGFGTYIHFLEGYLSRENTEASKETLERLVKLADVSESNIYVDTLVSPSYTTAICQVAQLPGISGAENNTALFEFAKKDPDGLKDIIDNYQLLVAANFDVCILASSDRDFGYHREIHVWLTPADYDNASLMILLAYIILGHPDWKNGVIKLLALFPEEELEKQRAVLLDLVKSGRLPIAPQNIEVIGRQPGVSRKLIVNEKSRDADLTIVGFVGSALRHHRDDVFLGYDGVGNVLFVNTTKEIDLVEEKPGEEPTEPEPADEADEAQPEVEQPDGESPTAG